MDRLVCESTANRLACESTGCLSTRLPSRKRSDRVLSRIVRLVRRQISFPQLTSSGWSERFDWSRRDSKSTIVPVGNTRKSARAHLLICRRIHRETKRDTWATDKIRFGLPPWLSNQRDEQYQKRNRTVCNLDCSRTLFRTLFRTLPRTG